MSDDPILVECLIAEADRDVTDRKRAAELAELLLGGPRQVEQVVGLPGAWLVSFTDAELAELKASHLFTRTSGSLELTAEYPSGEAEGEAARARIWELPS